MSKPTTPPAELRKINNMGMIHDYLKAQTTGWLNAELEQAHATACDPETTPEMRESAVAACVMMATELDARDPRQNV